MCMCMCMCMCVNKPDAVGKVSFKLHKNEDDTFRSIKVIFRS